MPCYTSEVLHLKLVFLFDYRMKRHAVLIRSKKGGSTLHDFHVDWAPTSVGTSSASGAELLLSAGGS